jgi:5-deoxy-glucuronate isomerase
MSKLKIHPTQSQGRIVNVTPQSAGWTHVGFDLWTLKPGEAATGGEPGREVCLVFISGAGRVWAGEQELGLLGERLSPFAGKPWSAYVPAGSGWRVLAETDVDARGLHRPGRGSPSPCTGDWA